MSQKEYKEYCDFTLDNDLQKIHSLNYLPWVGSNYLKQDEKYLVVAESIYNGYDKNGKTDEELKELQKKVEDQRYARWVIHQQGLHHTCDWSQNGKEKGMAPKYRRLTENFARAILNKRHITYEDKENVWTSVAFTELIQFPLKDRSQREIINKISINNGFDALIDTIKIIKPKKIIFIGTTNIDDIDNDSFNSKWCTKIGNNFARKGKIKSDDFDIPFVAIKHTSSFFSWSSWAKYLETQNFILK
ncbi:hypothetical protein [Psychroflexus maritimus]|uniref:Uracil DNA glycosylase superfamily protein n=1 Tax=Psychroflexus maritimus TaxID=2714865 RepID=A0A967AFR7_9FLAO|nr:hypothetical protein [Psychroflexus maritimus]NGZ90743.1 hypothetical protein [Psychroflexus maritimus]